MPSVTAAGHGVRRVTAPAAVAVLYLAIAKLGLMLATVGMSVTLVWPATGFALAVLLLGGFRFWPAVTLGALVANATTPGVPFLAACGIAAGNTAEALLGAYLLRRSGFDPRLGRVGDVLRLMALAGLVSTAVSALLGTASLWLGGVIPAAAIPQAFRVWWVGDMMGNLIFASLLLCWGAGGELPVRGRWREVAALLILLMGVSFLVFGRPLTSVVPHLYPYAVFPLLVWAALRFGPRGAAAANFVAAVVSVWGTVRGTGPFARASLDDSLLLLQTFMAVVTLTSLILGASAAERLRALRAREDFIAVASHELNTPLTPLLLQVQRINRVLGRGGPLPAADMGRALGRAEQQVERLARLVEELLDVARMRTGPLAIEPRDADLTVVVRKAVDDMREDLADAGCVLELSLPGTVPARCDPARLHQAVTNLLSNAVEHGPGKPITVTLSADTDRAVVRVWDQGPALKAEDRRRLFDRFERVAPDGSGGLGLGLYLVRGIAEAHGGRVSVESPAGAGAQFQMELPLRRA